MVLVHPEGVSLGLVPSTSLDGSPNQEVRRSESTSSHQANEVLLAKIETLHPSWIISVPVTE